MSERFRLSQGGVCAPENPRVRLRCAVGRSRLFARLPATSDRGHRGSASPGAYANPRPSAHRRRQDPHHRRHRHGRGVLRRAGEDRKSTACGGATWVRNLSGHRLGVLTQGQMPILETQGYNKTAVKSLFTPHGGYRVIR
jgi:hypothetical protein